MTHMKRQRAPKNWPIERKGTQFVVRGDEKGLPLLIVLRDILKIAKNKKEVKRALNKKEILISNKLAKDEKKVAKLLDTITIIPSKNNYRIILSEFGKFDVEEITDNEKSKKISRIINKKILKGKKTQINLWDGRNFLFEGKCKVNDSVEIDLEKNEIKKCIPLNENASALVIGGKHSGKKGKIKRIDDKLKMVELESGENTLNILIKQLMVIN